MDEKRLREFLKKRDIETDDYWLYLRAFTHSSYSQENYQRLEFLGDAVLNLIISDYLFSIYRDKKEGFLTKERASYVRKEILGLISEELGLKEFVRLGKGEEANSGRKKTSILSDVFESFLGAIYLDKGFNFTYQWILNHIDLFRKYKDAIIDYKSLLQERLQKKGLLPYYVLSGEEGVSHDKTYHVDLYIEGEKVSSGEGKNKKSAEQNAAKEALNIFKGL